VTFDQVRGDPEVLVIEYTTLTVPPIQVVSEAGAIGEVLTVIGDCPKMPVKANTLKKAVKIDFLIIYYFGFII
jgi:hypothetical protein